MSRAVWIAGAVLLGCATLGTGAHAATLSDAYLEGRWTTGGVDNCSKTEHEQTVFRKDGTFATEHSGKALAVGFWRIDEDRLEMNMLTTEASLPKLLQDELPGDYHALNVKGLVFDVERQRLPAGAGHRRRDPGPRHGEVPRLLTRPLRRRRLLQIASTGQAVLLVAPLIACDEIPPTAFAPWAGPPEMVRDPRLVALSWALLAPSPHNSQPWLVELAGSDGIRARLDQGRLLPVVDPDARQTLVGLGAFLELVALAANAQGSVADVALLAGADSETFAGKRSAAKWRHARPPILPHCHAAGRRSSPTTWRSRSRRCTRRRCRKPPAGSSGSALPPTRRRSPPCAMSWGPRSRSNTRCPRRLTEMAGWARLGAAEVAAWPDGLALTGTSVWWLRQMGLLSRASLASPGSPAWRLGRLQWENLIAGTASFGWLATDADGLTSRIAAGRAYQRVDLAAAAAGVAIHPVSQALGDYAEQAESRRRLDAILGTPAPARVQMLFRLGYAGPQAPSPRRPLAAILRL